MFRKFVPAAVAVLLLTACESTPQSGGQGATQAAVQPSTQTRTVDQTAVGAPRPGTQEELNATIGDSVLFAFDRSDLQPQSRATVEQWADWMRRYPSVSVMVEGHADERGTREYNLALGDRRAESVRSYLTTLGVTGNRVMTISYGKERPAVLGSNENAWAQNRRGVLVVQ